MQGYKEWFPCLIGALPRFCLNWIAVGLCSELTRLSHPLPFRIRQVFQICSSKLHPNQHNIYNWCCQQVKCLLAGCGFDSPLTNSSTGANIFSSLTQSLTVPNICMIESMTNLLWILMTIISQSGFSIIYHPSLIFQLHTWFVLTPTHINSYTL